MVVLVVFKDLSIKSHKGTYKVLFCNNLSNVIKKIDFSNSHIIIDKKVLEIYADLFNSVKNKKNFLIIKASEKNKSLENVTNAQLEATKIVFKSKKIPFRHIIFEKDNESELGKIITFFVLETILLSRLMTVNPFNQPAVELVKKETKKILLD